MRRASSHSPPLTPSAPPLPAVQGLALSSVGAAPYPLRLAAQGRTNTGGNLQPFAGDVYIYGATVGTADTTPQMYRSFCAYLSVTPTQDAASDVALANCKLQGDEDGRQRFKLGYDWTADWSATESWGKDVLWKQGLDGSSSPPWQQALTITLASNPIYCLDACPADVADADCAAYWAEGVAAGGTGMKANVGACVDERPSQRFTFRNETGEVVSAGAGAAGEDLCLAWHCCKAAPLTNTGYGIYVKPCTGAYGWDPAFFLETDEVEAGPIHGSFYFDPYRSLKKRSRVQPASVHDLTAADEKYKTISTEPAGKSYYDYVVWNTSVMSVVVAGNSTLTVATDTCPVEGCPGLAPEEQSAAFFHWSDAEAWKTVNESQPCSHAPGLMHPDRMCSNKHPCGCSDVTIFDLWTVVLDETTPFLNTLTIRGTLILQHDALTEIELHANLIEIRGGRLIFGNASHPFTGPRARIVLHGDMYFHGRECTVPQDAAVSEFGCWKQIVVNGELTAHGKPVPVVTRKLGEDALAGATALVLEAPVSGWAVGDELIVSGTDTGGVPEYFTLAGLSPDRRTVTLSGPLAHAKVGTTVTVPADPANGLAGDTVLDGRATVSLLERNVEIRGGYDLDYDYISGVGPDLTDYGVTIRTQGAYSEVRPGWDETMAGFDLYGVDNFPAGWVGGLSYVRFRGAGKQWEEEPVYREPPLVLHNEVAELRMEGVVATEPLTGSFFECSKVGPYMGTMPNCNTQRTSKTVVDSIFVGTSLEFAPAQGAVDVAERNLFFGGAECRIACPKNKMVTVGSTHHSPGTIRFVDNTAWGSYGGFTTRGACAGYAAWGGNVAIGNAVGFDVEAGCTSLFLEGYRNSVGVTANTPAVGNFLMAENGVGVTPGQWDIWPDQKKNLPGDVSSGGSQLGLVTNGTIVGRAPEVAGSVRSSNCDRWSGGGGHPWHLGHQIGGTMTRWRWFTEYDYSGFAAQVSPPPPPRAAAHGGQGTVENDQSG